MPVITNEMKEMIVSHQCFHGTVSKDGIPNVAPKRSTRIYDDNTLLYFEGTGGKTYQNILDGSKDVVAVVNREVRDGFRFVGTPEVFHEGDIYEKYSQISLNEGLPKPKAIILIKIEEIQTLKPGPNAGKSISD